MKLYPALEQRIADQRATQAQHADEIRKHGAGAQRCQLRAAGRGLCVLEVAGSQRCGPEEIHRCSLERGSRRRASQSSHAQGWGSRATNGLLARRNTRASSDERRRVGGGSAECTSAEGAARVAPTRKGLERSGCKRIGVLEERQAAPASPVWRLARGPPSVLHPIHGQV